MDKLLIPGLVCVIAAIVGGGLKAFGFEIPVLSTPARQLGLGCFGALLLIISVRSGPSASVGLPASNLPPQKETPLHSERIALWREQSPIAVAPPVLHCDCLDGEVLNIVTGQWERVSHGGHQSAEGTKLRFSSHCPSSVQLLAVRDTNPGANQVPINQTTLGRTFALENLSNGDSVVFDPNGVGPASLKFIAMNCPSAFARAVPFNCVSDTRLTPASVPPGPPLICPAQGPQGTTCVCNGRPGVNFLGDVPPYP
jgi:hypothetical protein